jgi:glycosyltransferase involved in cell wall biosynthesis
MEGPAVSIIIPVFNTHPYLRQCLDSVLGQTLKNIEVICVDNGSQDGSYELLNEYARGHPRLKVLLHPEGRQGGARNAALPIAQGEFIGFVDSDDLVAPTMFADLYDRACSCNADVVVCNMSFFNDKGSKLTRAVPNNILLGNEPCEIRQRPKMLRNLTICNKMFARRLINDHHIRFPEGLYNQDQYFVIKAFVLAHRIVSTPESLYFYRKNREGSVNEHRGKDNLHVFQVLQMVSDFLKESGSAPSLGPLIAEVKVSRILERFHLTGDAFKRLYFQKMQEKFREMEIPKPPEILSPTECHEFRVIRETGYFRYRLFLTLRSLYGRLLALPAMRSGAH